MQPAELSQQEKTDDSCHDWLLTTTLDNVMVENSVATMELSVLCTPVPSRNRYMIRLCLCMHMLLVRWTVYVPGHIPAKDHLLLEPATWQRTPYIQKRFLSNDHRTAKTVLHTDPMKYLSFWWSIAGIVSRSPIYLNHEVFSHCRSLGHLCIVCCWGSVFEGAV